LLLFLLNLGRRGWENFFSFFFGSQCVPQHNINNKNHDPPKPLAHASFEKEKTAPKSPHPPSKSQKYLPQHPTIPHPKVDIFNFLDCPPIQASLGLSTLFYAS
jgi:hypothetical protein